MSKPTLNGFKVETDTDGIAVVTWDMPGRTMNVFDATSLDELEALIGTTTADTAIRGVVITSGKETFCAGADLAVLQSLKEEYVSVLKSRGEEAAAKEIFEGTRKASLLFRKIETCGKPWVAAINGTALGGGFELALACHQRICGDNPKTRVGLPEVKIGLFPGAGGTTRLSRMMPLQDALLYLMKGDQLDLARAVKMKLVDAVVPQAELIKAAKEWIKAGGTAIKPWDAEGFRLPSGPVYSKAGMMTWPAVNGVYRRETYDNYPAVRAIIQSVYEGLQLPMDLALRVESRYFAKIVRSPEAAAMIRTFFVSMGELNKGARRPADVPPIKIKRVGIIGAGFMGASIGYVSASAGLDVVLIDRDQPSADKGKAHADKMIGEQVTRGRATEADREKLLARITPTTEYAALKDCDFIIEAVFEDRKVKADVIKKVQEVIGDKVTFGSNTSSLPITSLAQEFNDPARFIGVHFFSPVEKMPLVEIILGKESGDAALAAAMDFVRAIRKTPIVVNDSRGFYTSRVVTAYLLEGHLMLAEGVPPPMIENVARMAGMPVGPLSLNDEVGVDLGLKILKATEADLGAGAVDATQKALLVEMVEKQQRLGRKNGKGFYDYPETGKKRLWPGLVALQKARLDPDKIDVAEIRQRFLNIMALESARCLEENVVTDVREADVGSILGFGFAPYSGGTLSYIDMMGTTAFVAQCEALAKRHGERFRPNALLTEMAAKGETFYERFDPYKRSRAA